MPFIQYAKPSDAKRLAELAETTFRDAFAGANTIEDMNLHCQTSYGEEIQLRDISNADMVILICEDDEELIAFAQVRWSEAPSCISAKNPGEIQRLYVSTFWHGKGVARNLMAACIREMEDRESDAAWLGVWERNSRAIAFYRTFGFVEVGDHIFPVGTDPQRDIIMVRPISNGSPCA